MSDDLDARADDYEQRLHDAGGTDPLMVAMTVTVERSRAMIKILGGVAATLAVLLFGLGWVAVSARTTAQDARANTARAEAASVKAAANTVLIRRENLSRCLESRDRATRLNLFADTMSALESTNTTIATPLRNAREDAYRAMKRLPVPDCTT